MADEKSSGGAWGQQVRVSARRYTALMIATLLLMAALSAATAQAGTPAMSLHTTSCQVGTAKAAATCGTFTVPEDRSASGSRTITLHFVIIKATHPSNRAIVFNPGGPGASSTALAANFADADSTSAFTRLRDRYDLLLVDNRGTGKSDPQNCDFAPRLHPELYFAQLWPDSLVKKCRKQLAGKANLNDYSTAVAADDLDDLRAALGYPKLVLYGGSYGTRFYLAYARQYPAHVESIVLEGVAPPHFEIIPLEMAYGAQIAMTALIRACETDTVCEKHFPAFGQHFSALVRRFHRGPIAVPVQNPITKRVETVALSKEVFADRLREALYFPSKAAYVPVIIERAYDGNYAPLAELIDETTQWFSQALASGLNLSVTCAEDVPFLTQDDVARMSQRSFEGALRIRAQQRACRIWNVHPVPVSFVDPVRSEAPILMIDGTDDPASPEFVAREALPYLPNARMLVIQGGSHDSDLPPCVDPLIVKFVLQSSAKGLDLDHCGQRYMRPPFATLAPYESAPGEQVALSTRFRVFLEEMMKGHLDRSQLEPAVSNEFSAEIVKSFVAQVADLGPIESFIFKGSHASDKGTTYLYLVHFDGMNALASFTLDARGRIAGLDVSPG